MSVTNAKFYGLSLEDAAALAHEQDAAASVFWAYPDEKWQTAFQEGWLRSRGLIDAANRAREVMEELEEDARRS